jgi:hypothetical protein
MNVGHVFDPGSSLERTDSLVFFLFFFVKRTQSGPVLILILGIAADLSLHHTRLPSSPRLLGAIMIGGMRSMHLTSLLIVSGMSARRDSFWLTGSRTNICWRRLGGGWTSAASIDKSG